MAVHPIGLTLNAPPGAIFDVMPPELVLGAGQTGVFRVLGRGPGPVGSSLPLTAQLDSFFAFPDATVVLGEFRAQIR
ncbi:MAG: hypothetical protein FJX77_00695 [Armatimonadetes bacterium]|nr:hypothetical protein [Armatimonadota bacterium]